MHAKYAYNSYLPVLSLPPPRPPKKKTVAVIVWAYYCKFSFFPA